MSAIDTFRVVRGQDPRRLGLQNGDPSGFEQQGFQNQDVDLLCEFVTRTLKEALFTQAPEALVQRAVEKNPTMPLYFNQRKGFASFQGDSSRPMRGRISPDGTTHIDHAPLPDSASIAIRCEPRQAAHDVTLGSHVFHEGTHWLINHGVYASEFFNEACAWGLTDRAFKGRTNVEVMNISWREGSQGSTGLRAPDMGFMQREGAPQRGFAIAAIQALRHQSANQIWDICSALVQRAESRQSLPLWVDIRDAITGILGPAQAKKVLDQWSMQPMTEGRHIAGFPFGKSLHTTSFSVKKNPLFLMPDRTGTIQSTAFVVRDDSPTSTITVAGRGNARNLSLSGKLDPMHTLHFQELAEKAAGAAGGTVKSRDIASLTVNAGSLKFVLQKN